MPGPRHSTSPFSSNSPTTSERSKPEDPSSYKCSCGLGDGSGDYIQCDNEDCKLSWYHWECVQVTDAPAGTWLCPSCSPSAAFYIKQLVTKRAASPVVPKIEMTDEAADSKTRKQKRKPVLGINKEKDVARKGVAVNKRGVKKLKPKPKWRGWVELSSDGEQEFKKKVDAQWDVEDDLVGKRRRDSRAMIQETELSPRALRARSRPEDQINKRARDEDEDKGEDREAESDVSIYQEEDTSVHTSAGSEESNESTYQENEDTSVPTSAEPEESDESIYQQKEDTSVHTSAGSKESREPPYQENPQDAPVRRSVSLTSISSDDAEDSEKAPVRRRAPVIYISSDDSNDAEDTMDLDQDSTTIETNSSDKLSDPSSSSKDKRPSHLGQAKFASEGNHEGTAEDTEDSMDMEYEDALEYQDEEPQASRSDPPAGPESLDDAHSSSGSTPTPTNAPHGKEMANSQGPPPSEPAPATTRSTGTSGVSPILEASLPATVYEDAMDVRADDDDVQEILPATNPTVNNASLYERQDNRWGEFPESAIRSTLPRLDG